MTASPRFLRGDAKRQLHQVILDLSEPSHKIPVVIVDEAHLLAKEMLEEISTLRVNTLRVKNCDKKQVI